MADPNPWPNVEGSGPSDGVILPDAMKDDAAIDPIWL
jgi:hypothetical protein